MRVRLIALIIIGLLLAWVTFASAAADKTPVDCTIEANVLTCSLPEPSTQVTQTVTADPMTVTPDPVTVTEIPEPVTQIVTATVTATAAPTSTAPATSAAATTATTTPTAWPDASSTGVPAGTTLVASAMCSITVDGTVIDSRELNCPDGVSVAAKDVTIMNSKVNGHIYMDNDRSSDYSLTVIDSEVDGGDYIWPTIATGNTKIYRSNLHGGQNGLTCDDGSAFCEMYDSYVHGQNQQPDVDAHLGGFLSLGAQSTCTGTDGHCIVLKNNYIVCDAPVNDVGGGCTGGINLIPHFNKLHDVLIEGNRIGANTGQSYCTYGGELDSEQATGIVYRNNVFERGSNGKCGTYGPVTAFQFNPGNVWENNTWDDGGAVIPEN